MSEEMQQCQNCLKMFPQSKIPSHFGYCRRNIKKCQKCGEMYDINFAEDHQEEFHKTVPCSYCKISLHPTDLTKHESQCTKKPKFCEYCELQVPVQEFPSHLKACESRTKQCQKCRKPISNKDFLVHLTTCEGIIEQPKPKKDYNEFLREQRNQVRKQQPKREYSGQIQKPRVVERREYEYRPRQEAKRPEIKREVKNQYKYQYKPAEKKQTKVVEKYEGYKFREGLNSQPATNYTKPITSNHNIGAKVQVKQPSRKQIFPRQQPTTTTTTTTTYTNKYVRQVPKAQLQSRVIQTRVVEPPKVVHHPVIQRKVQKRSWEQEYRNDINPINNFENNGMINEDEQMQRAIFESMGQKLPSKPKPVQQQIPKELMGEDMMDQSFYGDLDIQKQMAMIREIQEKNKR